MTVSTSISLPSAGMHEQRLLDVEVAARDEDRARDHALLELVELSDKRDANIATAGIDAVRGARREQGRAFGEVRAAFADMAAAARLVDEPRAVG